MIVIGAGNDRRFGWRDGKPLVELSFDDDDVDDGHPVPLQVAARKTTAVVTRCDGMIR